jgi:hypothetical protein
MARMNTIFVSRRLACWVRELAYLTPLEGTWPPIAPIVWFFHSARCSAVIEVAPKRFFSRPASDHAAEHRCRSILFRLRFRYLLSFGHIALKMKLMVT